MGDRDRRPAALREPPAAGPRHGPRRRRRSPDRRPQRGPDRRPDLLHQVGHEPEHHRALQHHAPGLAAGRVHAPLHPGRLRALRPADEGFPGDPLRIVCRRWRPFRPGNAGLRAAGLDERQHRRDRAPQDPVGNVAGLSAEFDGRPRFRGAQPSGWPSRAAVNSGRGRILRCIRLRAGPNEAIAGRACGGRRASHLLQEVARLVPAWPLRAPSKPVRGRA